MKQAKYIVAQVGARRGYAVPAILESAGMLARFYTDICGNAGMGRILASARFASPELRRLERRQVPSTVLPVTRTFPLRTVIHRVHERLVRAEPAQQYRANLLWQLDLGTAAARNGFGAATHIFSMLGEFPTLLLTAKAQGLSVVSEVYTHLAEEDIVLQERRRFPGWEPGDHNFEGIRRELLSEDVMIERSDFFICPSDAVREDLVVNRGIPNFRTGVVPYGVGPKWLNLTPLPRRGRVLFVGTAGLRKGIHYLGMAAQRLAKRTTALEFRVAGNVSRTVASQPICRHLNFLGRVPRDRMHEEFQTADVFVLPSLAEGSAEVTYEALAAGVPVVTTKSAGSVVRDGTDGRIVPERDPDALADAIEELVEDRTLRDRMASAARERAADFTWQRYGERLISQLRKLPN